MTKETPTTHAQDSDRKHGQDPISNNTRATKELPRKPDKRKEARQEHTNHFTNREGYPEKK